METTGNLKTCSKCKETKHKDLFYRSARYKDGKYPSCKECQDKCNHEYYLRNKGKVDADRYKWDVENRRTMVSTIYGLFSKYHGRIQYVGSTMSRLDRRLNKHKSDAFNPRSKMYYTEICSAIRQYGWDNFEPVVISDEYSSYFTEDYFIKLLRPEFNVCAGNRVRRSRFGTEEELRQYLNGR